jgi:hypothetical protein
MDHWLTKFVPLGGISLHDNGVVNEIVPYASGKNLHLVHKHRSLMATKASV